jgi:hypothetical protein
MNRSRDLESSRKKAAVFRQPSVSSVVVYWTENQLPSLLARFQVIKSPIVEPPVLDTGCL